MQDENHPAGLRGLILKFFPERQLYLRANGQVQFLTLSTRTQIVALSLLVSTSVWVGVASTTLIFGNELLANKDQEIRSLKQERAVLANEVDVLREELLQRVDNLEERQILLKSLVDDGTAAGRGGSTAAAVKSSDDGETTKDIAVPDTSDLGADSRSGRSPPRADHLLASEIPVVSSDKPSVIARFVEIFDGALSGNPVERRVNASPLVIAMRDRLAQIEWESLDAALKADRKLLQRYQAVLARIDNTNIAADKVITAFEGNTANQGGPLVLQRELEGLVDRTPLDQAVQRLVFRREQLDLAKLAFESMPLAQPVDHYYISSRYGRRRDPMRKHWAMHSGLDMSGPWKSAVFSSAAGKVTHAGRNGPYGRMVEIDHGNGFITRYGHLANVLVEKGDVVSARDKIGLMGSSGRSTGTHVHYEVHFNGKPVDPAPFIKVGQNVQKSTGS